MNLQDITINLSRDLAHFGCPPPARLVYNPLEYASAPYLRYLDRYAKAPEILLVGMNPGPWGMAQTGVPFGDVGFVRDWLGIGGEVGKPPVEHPKRPVTGYACGRKEGSGRRLWGWARQRFETPERFFAQFFVVNYCPLVFYLEDGVNLTPDKLPVAARRELFAVCDGAMRTTVEILKPRFVLGVGRFAEQRVAASVAGLDVAVGGIPHPSPASPQANRGWAAQTEAALERLGIVLPSFSA
jgi:single-strand selective monofunctional uracil DNA glycosylase